MNGIENITAKIQADARQEMDAILAAAQAEAAGIMAGYEAQAKAEAETILARGEKAAAERVERLASMAQLECRKAVLGVKQEVIEAAFARAREKLLALPQEEYVALLADLAIQAGATGREKLIFSQADRARVGKAVVIAANDRLGAAGTLTLAEETRPITGGFILSDGAVEVNCTFDVLIRLQRGALAGEVAKVLFD